MASRIAFIGIGNMGGPMAARLAQAGHELCVADADLARAEVFAREHRCGAGTAVEAIARAELVITMLPTSAVVEAVLCGEGTAWQEAALVVEMSSGVPAHTQRIAARMAQRGVRLIDAPVSGGVKRAQAGELAIMCGGDAVDVDRAMPALRAMGTSIVHTGSVGSAHAMKALNNLVSAAGFVAGVEALLIGRKFGLDPVVMVDVLNASSGMTNSSLKKFRQFVLSQAFDSGFGLDLMCKDIGIALDLAQATKTAVPLLAATRELWSAAQAVLGAGRDHTEVARLVELLGGGTLAQEAP